VVASDPEALENTKNDLQDLDQELMSYVSEPYEACLGTDGILLLTDWMCYRDLDFNRIYDGMNKPAFFFDGRNLLDQNQLKSIGFEVYSIGRK
jgi:UDPglucose 6-dehydrogenase